MNLPNLPTESFYKFIAIAGSCLFFIGLVECYKEFKDKEDRFYKYQAQINIRSQELQILNDELKDLVSDSTIWFNDNEAQETIMFNKIMDEIHEKSHEFKIKNTVQESDKKIFDRINENDWIFIVYLIFMYAGCFIGTAGYTLWFYKIQQPLNNIENQKKLKEEFLKEECQSCLKTFLFLNERGNEIDGSVNKNYCKDCYSNGVFIEPELLVKEAVSRLESKLVSLNYSNRKIRRKKKTLNSEALRWKRKNIW